MAAQIAEHEGGYTPFEADVTDVIQPGAENRVTAAVNNVLTWQSIPPAMPRRCPTARASVISTIFFNYAGLHRPVWLYTQPCAHIADITVVTGLAGATGTIGYQVQSAGADGLHDFALMDWLGANSFRTSHYPTPKRCWSTPTGTGSW